MKLGLLSTARINELLVAGARQASDVEVVAIGSRDRVRAEAQAQALGVPRAHGSYEALLADPDVEAVYVALPNSLHVEWSLRALQAGQHVLCEKPLSRHPDDVARAFAAAQRGGLVLAEGFMWRHHPQAQQLVDLLDEIGELRRAGGAVERIAVEALNPYACELEDFAAAVAGVRPQRYGREDALAQARTIAALYASAETNEPMEAEP